jgi:hypothetical protein
VRATDGVCVPELCPFSTQTECESPENIINCIWAPVPPDGTTNECKPRETGEALG